MVLGLVIIEVAALFLDSHLRCLTHVQSLVKVPLEVLFQKLSFLIIAKCKISSLELERIFVVLLEKAFKECKELLSSNLTHFTLGEPNTSSF